MAIQEAEPAEPKVGQIPSNWFGKRGDSDNDKIPVSPHIGKVGHLWAVFPCKPVCKGNSVHGSYKVVLEHSKIGTICDHEALKYVHG